MKNRSKPWIERALYRLYRRNRGEISALYDAATHAPTARLGLLFGATIILPAMLLVVLSLSSISSEEVAIEAEIENAALSALDGTKVAVEAPMLAFERAATAWLHQPSDTREHDVSQLSGFLETVFLLDENNEIVAPFRTLNPPQFADASSLYTQAMLDGHLAQRASKLSEALGFFTEASKAATTAADAGAAAFAIAQTMAQRQTTPFGHANSPLHDVSRDYAHVRTRTGYQIGDLVNLSLGNAALQTQPELGALILYQMVEDALSATWYLDFPQDASVARLAHMALEQFADPSWYRSAQTRLQSRTKELYWADKLHDDVDVIRLTPEQLDGAFTYVSRPDDETLWAVAHRRDGHETALFVLNQHKLHEALTTRIHRNNSAQPNTDLIVALSSDSTNKNPLASGYLGPWQPHVEIQFDPTNDDLLSNRKRQARTLRFSIIAAALTTTVFGALLSAALITRESEAARMKTDFAANVSHELRSPITQIRIRAEALQLDLLDNESEKRDSYDAIVRESERLSRLVDNVLDFAAIEKGAKKYTFRPQDLSEVINSAINSCEEMIKAESIRLDIDVPYNIPVVWIDREAIAQVIINLVSNAVKYGSAGGWIGVRVSETPETVAIAVSDHGAGIPPDDLPEIFGRFFRSSDAAVRSKRGTGIGLTIVQYIVDAHLGTIEVESTVGVGTTFLITFPKTPHKDIG